MQPVRTCPLKAEGTQPEGLAASIPLGADEPARFAASTLDDSRWRLGAARRRRRAGPGAAALPLVVGRRLDHLIRRTTEVLTRRRRKVTLRGSVELDSPPADERVLSRRRPMRPMLTINGRRVANVAEGSPAIRFDAADALRPGENELVIELLQKTPPAKDDFFAAPNAAMLEGWIRTRKAASIASSPTQPGKPRRPTGKATPGSTSARRNPCSASPPGRGPPRHGYLVPPGACRPVPPP